MDQATRNSLQNATQQARRLLEREITEHLEGTFDVLPDGTIAEKPGKHLDASQRLVRTKIVESIRHRAGGSTTSEGFAAAVADYTREAAFTILNRYIALKMLEVRGLVQQCITKGELSSGFKEFCLAAPGLAQLPDKGYRLYLESLFDELSTEVKILFDRHSDASFLWPRRQAFDGLLEILNADDLATVWKEDETIGWVYQYFNSQEERRAMREASQAPRNSRELAVRNQFFTPRYVVEFLTDNTLGRTWYEMRQGVTTLAEKCRYLVRRPDEVFLSQSSVPTDGELEGPPLFAKFISDPECGSLLPFSADRTQAMIDLAHCVDGYVRHPPGQEIDGQWWPWHAKARIKAAADLAEFTTQDLLDVMFAQCRADRHGGGDGIQEPIFTEIADEVRRRVLESREPDRTQEQLLKQPVFVPFRAKKDPRDLKVLDPACGSSHFLIYCFDLLLAIYDEAWEDDQSPASALTENTLRADYPTLEALHAAVPGMILRHNLHGIDIDARCAQIGAFALWMRAQRAYADFKLAKEHRPPITRSNIVVAEPMPGQKDLQEDLLRTLKEDRLESLIREALDVPANKTIRATKAMADSLCDLVRTIWDRMKLAGEAGSLLRIEKDLDDAIRKGRQEWEEKSPLFRVTEYGLGDLPRTSLTRELPGEEADFWSRAEVLVLHALRAFARGAGATAAASFRRGLFAEDAARGLAFIDVCRVQMDVVLMNPPFGAYPQNADTLLSRQYPNCRGDLYPSFIERWTASTEMLGAITNRTGLLLQGLEDWRRSSLLHSPRIQVLVDLGSGVLDALVETAAYVVGRCPVTHLLAIDLLTADKRECGNHLLAAISSCQSGSPLASVFCRSLGSFVMLPGCPIAYRAPGAMTTAFSSHGPMESDRLIFRTTSPNYDDFRYLRLRWEVDPARVGRDKTWSLLVKGGEYQPFIGEIDLVINWDDNEQTYRGFLGSEHRPLARPACADLFFTGGLTWTGRTTSRFSPRVLPRGVAFSSKGPYVGGRSDTEMLEVLGVLASRPFQAFLELFVQAGDDAARDYQVGTLRVLPDPGLSPSDSARVTQRVLELLNARYRQLAVDESSIWFDAAQALQPCLGTVSAICEAHASMQWDAVQAIAVASEEIDERVANAYGLDREAREYVNVILGPHPLHYETRPLTASEDQELRVASVAMLQQRASEHYSARRFIEANSHLTDRWLELACHAYQVAPPCLEVVWKHRANGEDARAAVACRLVSALMGVALGRWGSSDWLSDPVDKRVHDWLEVPKIRSLTGSGTAFAEGELARPATRANGILADDNGHDCDMGHAIEVAAEQVWGIQGQTMLDSINQQLQQCALGGLQDFVRSGFFARHCQQYSGSRRTAPIYWQLGVPSAKYSVWLYAHRVTNDRLFSVLNDIVRPKVRHEEDALARVKAEAGASPTRGQRQAIEVQEDFVAELKGMADEVARVAPLWAPDLDDGVVICLAPLWRLFPQHKPWQKECKQVWDSLVAGDYDWSHMAMHLWPERVVPKCITDRSLAIAHGLEDVFWEQNKDEKWVRRKPPEENGKAGWQPTIDRLVAERTSRQVKDALASLLAAPVADGGKRGRRAAAAAAAESTTNGESASKGRKRKSKARDESEELF